MLSLSQDTDSLTRTRQLSEIHKYEQIDSKHEDGTVLPEYVVSKRPASVTEIPARRFGRNEVIAHAVQSLQRT